MLSWVEHESSFIPSGPSLHGLLKPVCTRSSGHDYANDNEYLDIDLSLKFKCTVITLSIPIDRLEQTV